MAMDGKSVIGATSSVREAYANQADYCRANDSPVTARIVAAIGTLLDAPDPGGFIARIRDWPPPMPMAPGWSGLVLSPKTRPSPHSRHPAPAR